MRRALSLAIVALGILCAPLSLRAQEEDGLAMGTLIEEGEQIEADRKSIDESVKKLESQEAEQKRAEEKIAADNATYETRAAEYTRRCGRTFYEGEEAQKTQCDSDGNALLSEHAAIKARKEQAKEDAKKLAGLRSASDMAKVTLKNRTEMWKAKMRVQAALRGCPPGAGGDSVGADVARYRACWDLARPSGVVVDDKTAMRGTKVVPVKP